MKKVLTILAVVLAVGAIGLFVMVRDGEVDAPTTTDTRQTDENTQNQDIQAENDEAAPENTLTYDGSRFTPERITVKSGERVTIKNNGSRAVQFSSDDHPIHSDNPELNTDSVAAGSSTSFTVNEKGTFGFHDHLNPAATGTIIVE